MSIHSQATLLLVALAVFVVALLFPPEPGPPIREVKTKQVDVRGLIK